EGVWVGIGADPPELPPTGEYQRGGGVMPFLECMPIPGEQNQDDPEASEACKSMRAQYQSYVAAYRARFQRVYRIDSQGVREARGDKLAPIAGAKAASKPGRRGATAEVSLPRSALPRMSEAPVAGLLLVARAATAPAPPEIEPEAWVSLALPEP